MFELKYNLFLHIVRDRMRIVSCSRDISRISLFGYRASMYVFFPTALSLYFNRSLVQPLIVFNIGCGRTMMTNAPLCNVLL